jgi:hypothetical protein
MNFRWRQTFSKTGLGTCALALALMTSMSMFTTACSPGSAPGDETRAQQARDAKALEDLYSSVQGTWDGELLSPGLRPLAARLSVYIVYLQDGANPDGSARLRPTLRARFLPQDVVTETDQLTLAGDYDRGGRLVMTSLSSGAGSDVMLSLRGQASGEQMQVELARKGGVWGVFRARRTSVDSMAPGAGAQQELRERWLRIHRPMEGAYAGTVRATAGTDFPVEIALVIVERPSSTGVSTPELQAQYRRLDFPSGIGEWNLKVDYNAQTGEIAMRDSSSAPSTIPGANVLSITGTWQQGLLRVEIRNKNSVVGFVEAKR